MNFNEMNLSNEVQMALEDMGFTNPTPVQEQVIPLLLNRRDIIAQAPTGTGKTCAFGIPVINGIDLTIGDIQALILCPTRELVIQTENELKEVAKYQKEIKIVSIYGGQNYDRQLAGLKKKPQIVIGTTGRVMDHLRRKSLKLSAVKILILDEVDEMLDMGFKEDIDVILENVPTQRQTVLFSATMPKEIVEISKRYQDNPINIKTQHQESDIPNINQYYVNVRESEKIHALVSIMQSKKYNLVLVFCNTKKRVDELNEHMISLGINSDALHGDLRQHNRDKTMRRFRSGETQMLIATDVAARGIDVDDIGAIFNFDIPHDEEDYVHRIGRTARAGKTGDVYTFVSDKQMYVIKNFERYTKNPILKAEYSAGKPEAKIDKKIFEKTLKLLRKGALTPYREFLESEYEGLKEKYGNTEMLDIAAALLMQLSEAKAGGSVTLSEPPMVTMRNTAKRNQPGGVKFFMNIGTRDQCDSLLITKFIAAKTGIDPDKILSVNCLENFSFAEIAEGNNEAMEALNGIKYNKRILAVELAAASGKKKNPDKKFSEQPHNFKSDKSTGGKKSYGSEKFRDGSKRFEKKSKTESFSGSVKKSPKKKKPNN